MDTPMAGLDTRKFAELLIGMSTDFLLGGITEETYLSNLRIYGDMLREKK